MTETEARSKRVLIVLVPLLLLPALVFALVLLTDTGDGPKVVSRMGLDNAKDVGFLSGVLLGVPCAVSMILVTASHWRRVSAEARIVLLLANAIAAFPPIAIVLYFYGLSQM